MVAIILVAWSQARRKEERKAEREGGREGRREGGQDATRGVGHDLP